MANHDHKRFMPVNAPLVEPGFDLEQVLIRQGRQPLFQQRLMKCPMCDGAGMVYSRFSFLWGHSCWGCGGWGAIRSVETMYLSPFQPHPYRYTTQEA